MPRSRRPSARLTAVVDLPTPPLPEATAIIEATPGTPDGPCCGPWPCVCAARPPAGAPCGGLAAAAPALALCRQRHHRRLHAGHCLDRLLGALSHRLPSLHHAGIDGDREEHLAVARDDLRQRAGVGQRRAVRPRDFAEALEDVFPGDRHGFVPANLAVTIVSRALWSTEPSQVIDRAKSRQDNACPTPAGRYFSKGERRWRRWRFWVSA